VATAAHSTSRQDAAVAARLRCVQLLDARQVAGLLNISRATLWRYVKAERVPQPVRLAEKCVRWRLSDIERLLGVK